MCCLWNTYKNKVPVTQLSAVTVSRWNHQYIVNLHTMVRTQQTRDLNVPAGQGVFIEQDPRPRRRIWTTWQCTTIIVWPSMHPSSPHLPPQVAEICLYDILLTCGTVPAWGERCHVSSRSKSWAAPPTKTLLTRKKSQGGRANNTDRFPA